MKRGRVRVGENLKQCKPCPKFTVSGALKTKGGVGWYTVHDIPLVQANGVPSLHGPSFLGIENLRLQKWRSILIICEMKRIER